MRILIVLSCLAIMVSAAVSIRTYALAESADREVKRLRGILLAFDDIYGQYGVDRIDMRMKVKTRMIQVKDDVLPWQAATYGCWGSTAMLLIIIFTGFWRQNSQRRTAQDNISETTGVLQQHGKDEIGQLRTNTSGSSRNFSARFPKGSLLAGKIKTLQVCGFRIGMVGVIIGIVICGITPFVTHSDEEEVLSTGVIILFAGICLASLRLLPGMYLALLSNCRDPGLFQSVRRFLLAVLRHRRPLAVVTFVNGLVGIAVVLLIAASDSSLSGGSGYDAFCTILIVNVCIMLLGQFALAAQDPQVWTIEKALWSLGMVAIVYLMIAGLSGGDSEGASAAILISAAIIRTVFLLVRQTTSQSELAT